jgi:putative oxidoreductase
MSLPKASTDRGLLVLRMAIAAVFIAHGYMKLFTMGHAGVTGFFEHLGIPLPGANAWFISILEFAGGLSLLAGLFTRIIAALLACDMIGAIVLARLSAGFVGGWELEFLLATGALSLALAGAGAYSVDARMAGGEAR